MGWEQDLFALFDDLEGQAQAAFEEERDLVLADRALAEYAQVSLAGRLMASQGLEVRLTLATVGPVIGVLERVASGWCVVAGPGQEWVVNTDHVVIAEGLSDRAVPEVAWRAPARLPLRSALRSLAGSGQACVLHHLAGTVQEGTLGRVGHDFAEVVTRQGSTLVAFAGLVAVQSRGVGT